MSNQRKQTFTENTGNRTFNIGAESACDTPDVETFLPTGKELLDSCFDIQELMEKNREMRLQTQQQLSKIYRCLPQQEIGQGLSLDTQLSIQSIRHQLTQLDKENRTLHRQYICQQARFRRSIVEQRQKLLETINRTRALTATPGSRLSLVACNSVAKEQSTGPSFDAVNQKPRGRACA